MSVRPIARSALLTELADRIAALRLQWRVRVALDGPPPAEPDTWAAQLVDELRGRGRPAIHIAAGGFLRPASQRLEFGRTNPDAFYESWRDDEAIRREVLSRRGWHGRFRHPTAMAGPARPRPDRTDYLSVPADGVVIISGGLLLGSGLPFDLTVHFEMNSAALARLMPVESRWTIPAYERYATEVMPSAFVDIVVRLNDRRRPAVVDR